MSLGVLFALLAALGWGAGDVMFRRALPWASNSAVLLINSFFVLAVLGIVTLLVHGIDGFTVLTPRVLGLIALMGALAYLTGLMLFLQGIRRAGVTIAAPIIAAAPLVALILAVTLGGERPGVLTVVGAIIIVVGIGVIVSERNRVQQ
jgi:drug/metabolite transporter (DMT)-like permease